MEFMGSTALMVKGVMVLVSRFQGFSVQRVVFQCLGFQGLGCSFHGSLVLRALGGLGSDKRLRTFGLVRLACARVGTARILLTKCRPSASSVPRSSCRVREVGVLYSWFRV